MLERCPLNFGEHRIDDIPDFCLTNCEKHWSQAITEQVGYLDYYDPSKDDCNHERYSVEHSHEGIEKPDESERRNYSIVDMCENCEMEIMETSYYFECPYNNE